VRLALLLLSLAVGARADDDHHHHKAQSPVSTPAPPPPADQNNGGQAPPPRDGQNNGGALTDQQLDEQIRQWKGEINGSSYHRKQKERLTGYIDTIHGRYHDESERYKEGDPRGQPTQGDIDSFKNVVRADADLESRVWRIGRAHGLDAANNKEHIKKLQAAVSAGHAGDGGDGSITDGAGIVKFTKAELAEIETLAQAYNGSLRSLSAAGGAATVFHNLWHDVAMHSGDANGGMGYTPPKLRDEHDKNYAKDQKEDPYPLVFSGSRDLMNGDASAAASKARAALNLDPRDQQALDLAAASNYQLKNFQDASAAAKQALSQDPNDETARAVLDATEGRAAIGDASLGADPFGGLGAPNNNDGAVAGGRFKASLSASNAVAAHSSGLLRDAMGSLQVGDAAAAISTLDKALALNADNAQALYLRSVAYARQRRYAEALRDADAGLKIDPKNSSLMNARAMALNKLKRYSEAEAQARAAIEANPNDANAWRNLAEALAGLGDRQGALAALTRAAALDARFKPALDVALQLPNDADLNLLFSDDGIAPGSMGPRKNSGRARRRFGVIAGAAAAGGLLIVLGLLPALLKPVKETWTRMTKRQVVRAAEMKFVEPLVKGQYRLGREIGAGGMGTVYEGFDVNLERPVALKKMRDEIRADPRERARFIQEAKVVAALHHPNIVDIYAISEEGEDVFLIFQFIKGKTLHEVVASRGRLTLDQALPLLKAAADGLEYAHKRGVIHRDLKPSNIMLDQDGSVKVMDFGIARVAKDALTKLQTNTIVGTPPYMAPEQEQGLVRKESDVYALALCLYEMLTGRMAFSGTGAGMLMNKLNKAYAPVTTLAPELPSEIDAVFSAALEPDPGKRIASPTELVARVAAVAKV
jgi:tetratricopeptide (TPR) repeat protein